MKNFVKNTHFSSRKDGQILNIGLNSTSEGKVLAFVRDSLAREKKFFITTPNPEIVVYAQNDKQLYEALNFSNISLPDGVGLVFAWRFLGLPGTLKRVKGREMFSSLMNLANKKGWRVFLLGGKGEVADKSAEILKRSLGRVKIESAGGPNLNQNADPISPKEAGIELEAIRKINKFKPHLLFVAFGAPKQEKWVYKWFSRLEVGGVMVVGGTFDYISGKASLPPEWMEKAGLEWLWRIIRQPWRIKRVLSATIIFPLKVASSKLGL